jgi:hypothetical protein
MDWSIQQAILHKYSDPKKSGMHLDIKNAFKESASANPDTPEEYIIAAGIYKMCTVTSYLNFAPVRYGGVDVSTKLGAFKIMPKKKKVA